MKRHLMMLGLAAALLSPSLGSVQAGEKMDKHTPEQMQAKKLEKLTKKLNLTADQQTQVKQILADQHEQIKPLVEQMKSVREQTKTKIEGVLNDDQKKKFAEMKKKKEKKSKDVMGH